MVAWRGQAGFTVVEFAIVLVVIGLLIGGVLKGQEMDTRARVSRMENDEKAIAAAILAYRERYGVLPGDDPAASTRFAGAWSRADDGNGDGAVQGAWNATAATAETRKLWKHLRGAGLLAGPVDQTPASYQAPLHAFGGPVGFQQGVYNLPGNALVFGGVPGDAGSLVESRGDDGRPAAGAIQGSAGQAAYNTAASYDLAFRL